MATADESPGVDLDQQPARRVARTATHRLPAIGEMEGEEFGALMTEPGLRSRSPAVVSMGV